MPQHTNKKFFKTFFQSRIFLMLLLLSIYFFGLTAQNGYEIRKITITGNRTFEKSELLKKTTLHESNWIKYRIFKKEPVIFNEKLLETDLERITRFYQTEGFLFASVRLDSIAINQKKQTVDLFIEIDEKAPVNFGNIQFDIQNIGSLERKDSLLKILQQRIEPKKGKRFRDEQVYKDESKIENIFINNGYAYVEVEHQLELLLDSNLTNLIYKIQPHDICFFGKTEITGNKYVKEKLIRQQLAYKEGEIFSTGKLDKTRKHLFDLQLFRVASLQAQTDAANHTNPIPVKLMIEEIPHWNAEIGLGYGTEDQFRAFLNLSAHSLWGDASRFNFYAKHSALDPYYLSLSWIQPQFLRKNTSFQINPFLRRQAEPGFNVRTYGLNLPFGYSFSEKANLSLRYYLESVKQYSEPDSPDFINPESENYLYSKSGLLATFQYNHTYPQASPERGELINIGAKFNGYFFGGDFDYYKIWIDGRKYAQAGDFNLAVRLMAGSILSSDKAGYIPVEDRFYSGGSNSVRGWSRSALGPKREDGTPLGGKSILESGVEIRHPLFWLLEGAIFLDAGNVWTSSFHFPVNDLAYSAGAGVRIKTPVGAIRLDVSIPLWNEKKSVQFFLNVGQAF
jgi:outer membrane protein insertion porin family